LILPVHKIEDSYPLITLDPAPISSLFAQLFPLIRGDRQLIMDLVNIRSMISVINLQQSEYSQIFAVPMSMKNRKKMTSQHNTELAGRARDIVAWARDALQRLESKYGVENPLPDKTDREPKSPAESSSSS